MPGITTKNPGITVDASEIQRSPFEVGSLSVYPIIHRGFKPPHPQVGWKLWDFWLETINRITGYPRNQARAQGELPQLRALVRSPKKFSGRNSGGRV